MIFFTLRNQLTPLAHTLHTRVVDCGHFVTSSFCSGLVTAPVLFAQEQFPELGPSMGFLILKMITMYQMVLPVCATRRVF